MNSAINYTALPIGRNVLTGGNNNGGGLLGIIPDIRPLEFLLAASVFVIIHSLQQRKRRGLVAWPLVGMLPSLLLGLRGNIYEWVTAVLGARGGTFVFKGPWLTNLHCVITADPRNLEHLLKTKFASFPKGPYFREQVHDLLGGGIFGADDEPWRKQRKAASLEFHSAEFRSLAASSLSELVHSRLLPVLAAAHDRGEAVDLQNILLKLTFDNVCMIALGTDPGCLRPGLPEIPFAKAFEDATEATTLRFIIPTTIWKLLRYFDLGTERCLRRAIERVDEFAYEVIRARKQELASSVEHPKEEASTKRAKGSDLLTVFMRLKDQNGAPFSDKFLRDVCVNLILAGRDTSSVALAWFFWVLNKHPDVEERILEELGKIENQRGGKGCEGDVDRANEGESVFRPEELKKMVYLQAALTEALRLYPSVPVDHKEVVEDEVFPDGTVLRKGTKVLYAIFSMGRMESIWGKDCRDYKPERWLRDGHFVNESAYKFSAFNGGPRLCLGKDFAYHQMKYVAASVLRCYHVRVVENHPVAPKMALTMYMKHGLKVTLERRVPAPSSS